VLWKYRKYRKYFQTILYKVLFFTIGMMKMLIKYVLLWKQYSYMNTYTVARQ